MSMNIQYKHLIVPKGSCMHQKQNKLCISWTYVRNFNFASEDAKKKADINYLEIP